MKGLDMFTLNLIRTALLGVTLVAGSFLMGGCTTVENDEHPHGFWHHEHDHGIGLERHEEHIEEHEVR